MFSMRERLKLSNTRRCLILTKLRLWSRRRQLLVCTCFLLVAYFGGKYVINSNAFFPMAKINLKQLSLNIDDRWLNALLLKTTPGPKRQVFDVSCKSIIDGDRIEIKKAIALMNNQVKVINDSKYNELTRNCDSFKEKGGYYDLISTQEEREFPIAYSILMYKDVEQAERLLRAIYRPQNYYCFHVDTDAEPMVHNAVDGIADCFDNVFVVTRKEKIVYQGFTRLQADLNCMSDLMFASKKWKYFINLPSQEFPIKTNQEIVKILKIYNGANDIEGITGRRAISGRYKYRFVYKHVNYQVKPKIFQTDTLKDDPPHNITVVKGSAYGVFSRAFVEFVTENRVARELLDWFRDVLSPDEYYWATLHHNPHIGTPGAYKSIGKPDDKPWLAVYAAWAGQDRCAGKFVRGVCVFGVGDLQKLVNLPYLFANKFHIDFQPLALNCMEEWLYNRTFERDSLNLTYYRNLPFIYNEKQTNIH